ncbi:MAG: tetratricopeptide repeat protein, partial [Planctomycetota bacterium]
LDVAGAGAPPDEAAVTAPPSANPLLANAPADQGRGVAHFSLGSLFGMIDETELARGHLTEAVDCYESAGEAFKRAEVLTSLAILEQHEGNFTAAVSALEKAHDLIEQDNDQQDLDETLATTTQLLGTAYRMSGRLEEARETLGRALQQFEALEDPSECADTLDALGVVEQIQGNYDAAEELHLKALAVNESIGSEDGMSLNYGNLTMLNLHLQNFDQAATYAHQAYEVDKKLGNENGLAYFHLLMGEIECWRGNYDEAEKHLTECMQQYESIGDAEDRLSVKGKFAFLYRLRGDLDRAAELNEEVLSAVEEMGFPDGVAATLDELAHVRLAQGRTGDAKSTWERALQIYKELNSVRMIREISEHLADL